MRKNKGTWKEQREAKLKEEITKKKKGEMGRITGR
jgi:hypothetical protein